MHTCDDDIEIDLHVCSHLNNVRNKCPFPVTACDQAQGSGVTCYALQNGGQRGRNVGTTWTGGLVWGFPSGSGDPNQGNAAKPQANLAEITINAGGQDFYDLSNVVSAITDQCLRIQREFSYHTFAPEFPGSVVIINQSAQMMAIWVLGTDLAMTTLPDLFFDLTRLAECLQSPAVDQPHVP
jgi:hypothetical protein